MAPYMTKDEIIARYRNMDRNKHSIKILADLNACSASEIKEIVASVAAEEIVVREKPKKPSKPAFDGERRRELYNQGLTDMEIGFRCGTSANAIWVWRKNNNLPATHHKGKTKPSTEATSDAPTSEL